jgi:demethylmenaquinone methyltransferase/2-methoxy-6-polyprenyl-1,4-benzoquinol methylase
MSNQEDEMQRVNRTKAETQATYDRISGWYNLLEGMWEKGARDLGLRKLDVQEGERVLEIGFGPGQDLLTLARAVGQQGRVFGVDLSPKMVHITQANSRKAGLAQRIDLARGDAQYLPFKNGAFSAIFISFTLELFDTPDIPEVLAQCRRVLQSRGGRVCIVSLSKEGKSTWMRRLYEWGHDRFPGLLDCRPIFVRTALEAAGFEILDAIPMSILGLPVEVVLASHVD